MTKTRRMSVFLILLSSAISIFWGLALGHSSPGGTINFRAIYYGTRCLIHHKDPYNEADFLHVYKDDGGEFPTDANKAVLFGRAVPICVNLPTTLFLIVPLALLTWGPAHVLWLTLMAASFVLAAFLAFDLVGERGQGIALFLIFIVLANSEVLFAVGNTAGFAVSLCIVATWCFIRERFLFAGVLCLALSLALKPHDSGLVWFYFLLAGGAYRKRALQSLLITGVLALPALLWVSSLAPQWMSELRGNLAATSARGDISDPGPNSINVSGSADIIIDLQTVASIFRDDPGFYNPLSYLISGGLLLVWSVTTLTTRMADRGTPFALASIAALSMLATYHRPYDAKLLLLAIPACAVLWSEGGPVAWIALSVTTAATALTGDIPLGILKILTKSLNLSTMGWSAKLFTLPLMRPAPLALLVMAIFYLWMFKQRVRKIGNLKPGSGVQNGVTPSAMTV